MTRQVCAPSSQASGSLLLVCHFEPSQRMRRGLRSYAIKLALWIVSALVTHQSALAPHLLILQRPFALRLHGMDVERQSLQHLVRLGFHCPAAQPAVGVKPKPNTLPKGVGIAEPKTQPINTT
eukprot:scaffold131301_cov32-Tisochrysis_lutea.AAC.10